ncbi:MAG TPA: sulfite exporter TauE/SafE family protein, partial [Saprospiraceae bacterium]|nr:sulfite exporter TauE/SafE family protein [Saprospiraceae bacterium]
MYSALFMAIFGLGTMPALVLTTFGLSKANLKFRNLVSKLYPILMIGLGVLMFYRGWIMQVPRELNFWDALNNPVMCH